MSEDITITPAEGTWVVRAGGAVLGESTQALILKEGDMAPVVYFPRADIAMALLDRTDTTTECPKKGTANYYSIMSKSKTYTDAVWTYEDPKDGVAQIKEYLAFETQDGVDVEDL